MREVITTVVHGPLHLKFVYLCIGVPVELKYSTIYLPHLFYSQFFFCCCYCCCCCCCCFNWIPNFNFKNLLLCLLFELSSFNGLLFMLVCCLFLSLCYMCFASFCSLHTSTPFPSCFCFQMLKNKKVKRRLYRNTTTITTTNNKNSSLSNKQ